MMKENADPILPPGLVLLEPQGVVSSLLQSGRSVHEQVKGGVQ